MAEVVCTAPQVVAFICRSFLDQIQHLLRLARREIGRCQLAANLRVRRANEIGLAKIIDGVFRLRILEEELSDGSIPLPVRFECSGRRLCLASRVRNSSRLKLS